MTQRVTKNPQRLTGDKLVEAKGQDISWKWRKQQGAKEAKKEKSKE